MGVGGWGIIFIFCGMINKRLSGHHIRYVFHCIFLKLRFLIRFASMTEQALGSVIGLWWVNSEVYNFSIILEVIFFGLLQSWTMKIIFAYDFNVIRKRIKFCLKKKGIILSKKIGHLKKEERVLLSGCERRTWHLSASSVHC